MIPNNKILGAQHLASMKKESFPSHPKVNVGHLWQLPTSRTRPWYLPHTKALAP